MVVLRDAVTLKRLAQWEVLRAGWMPSQGKWDPWSLSALVEEGLFAPTADSCHGVLPSLTSTTQWGCAVLNLDLQNHNPK
jgi:hypothetical protein